MAETKLPESLAGAAVEGKKFIVLVARRDDKGEIIHESICAYPLISVDGTSTSFEIINGIAHLLRAPSPIVIDRKALAAAGISTTPLDRTLDS